MTFTTGLERDQLERDEPLVVIGADHRVERLFLHGVIEDRVGWAEVQMNIFREQFFGGRDQNACVLVAEEVVFAQVRIDAGESEPRFRDSRAAA
ncbi:MAG: hypothetical protein WDO13_16035 [Verrucomicrobiota bacterium]